MLTDVKPRQYENAQSPTAVTLYTISSMVVTIDGIIITESEIHICSATFTEILLITVYFSHQP